MFIDGREGGAPGTDYDLVVIGSGPAGIALAHELRASGLRIALLESGGLEYDDDTQMLYEGRMEGNDDAYDLASIRLRFWGGTSNHWGGHCTPLDPIDFERAPRTGLTGWTMSRDTLVPYYERAQVYCDIGSFDYSTDMLKGFGPKDEFLPDNPNLETAILRQSLPTRFGEKYHDVLGAAPDVHVWLWTNVLYLEFDPEGAVAAVHTRTLTGIDRAFTARAVVMACGAVENARLLLASNARNGTTYGNRSDLLGRCYMDHPSGGAAFLYFNEPQGPKIYWADEDAHAVDGGVPLHFVWRLTDAYLAETGLNNAHYYVLPFASSPEQELRRKRANESLGSLKGVGKYLLGRDVGMNFDLSKEYCEFVANADALVAEQVARFTSKEGVQRVLLKYEAEQTPDLDNFVMLDPVERDALGQPRAVLRWAPSEDDMESVRETARIFGRFAGEAGLARMQIEDHDAEPYWGTTTAWHQLGTTRMAPTESTGVVDGDGQVFGTRGLYVAGGSVMPTSGRANPTLTIVALSIRLADHLATKVPTL